MVKIIFVFIHLFCFSFSVISRKRNPYIPSAFYEPTQVICGNDISLLETSALKSTVSGIHQVLSTLNECQRESMNSIALREKIESWNTGKNCSCGMVMGAGTIARKVYNIGKMSINLVSDPKYLVTVGLSKLLEEIQNPPLYKMRKTVTALTKEFKKFPGLNNKEKSIVLCNVLANIAIGMTITKAIKYVFPKVSIVRKNIKMKQRAKLMKEKKNITKKVMTNDNELIQNLKKYGRDGSHKHFLKLKKEALKYNIHTKESFYKLSGLSPSEVVNFYQNINRQLSKVYKIKLNDIYVKLQNMPATLTPIN